MLRRSCRRLVATRSPVSNFLRSPGEAATFEETIARCRSENVDASAALTADFALLQARLLPYRVARVADDMRYIRANPGKSFPSFANLVRHLVLLPLLFIVGVCVGRGSTRPLVPPPTAPAAATAPAEETPAAATASKAQK